jgi:hypothetical protein
MHKILVFSCLLFSAGMANAQPSFQYHDAKELTVIGRGFANTGYARLPAHYKDKLRADVWNLGLESSGIGVRFATNSTAIDVKWKTGNNTHYPHGAETMVKGVDLYCLQNGKWFFAGVGKPYDTVYNQATIAKGLDSSMKEFLLYLPLYETVDSVFIGIEAGSEIRPPGKANFRQLRPLVFYGTSITQGASAMRPGMQYTSIIERALGIETINLGFSGNGRLEEPLADLMSEIPASCYVIDCGGNLTPQLAMERTKSFISHLRQKAPGVPVLLVGHLYFTNARFNESVKKSIDSINTAFRLAYIDLKRKGMKQLYYLDATNLIGTDGEATVDGAHLTDLGFMRIAAEMERPLRKILNLPKP